jgi:hypothetical protein
MLNVPGTMLIVRRKQRGSGMPSYVPVYVKKDVENVLSGKTFSYNLTRKNILFGEACILLDMKIFQSIENKKIKHIFSSAVSSKAHLLSLLYCGQIVCAAASPNQMKKWFTFPDIWEKKRYGHLLNKYEANGTMQELRIFTGKF